MTESKSSNLEEQTLERSAESSQERGGGTGRGRGGREQHNASV